MSIPEISFEEIQYQIDHQWDTRQDSLRAGTLSLLFAAIISVALRLYARRIQGLSLRWNDHTIIIALVLTTAMCAVILKAVDVGFGLHIVIIGKRRGIETAKMLYVAEVLFPAANSSARISALLLYQAIFGGNCARWFRIGIRVLAGLFVLLALSGTFCTALQCIPVRYAWETDHAIGCLDLQQMMFALTVASVCLNVATLALPMPLIWNLRMSIRRKLAIGMLFTLGGADVVVNILRAAHTHTVSTKLIDFTWLQCTPVILGVVELTLGIVCVCIPTLRPIFTKISNAMAKSTQKAGISNTSWTVPFVLLKTKTGGHTGELRPYHPASLSTEWGLDEKSLENSMPRYSNPTPPEPTASRPSRFSHLKTSLFRKSRHTTIRSGSIPVGFAPDGSPRDSGTQMSIEPMIAQNLLQSGYKKAFHPPDSPQFQKPFANADQSPPQTPQHSRATSHKSRHTLKSLYSRKSEETPRPSSRGKLSNASPYTDHSSPTLLGEPDDRKDIQPPMPDLNAALSKAGNEGLGINTDPPLLRPNRYQPPSKIHSTQKRSASKNGPPLRNKSDKSAKSAKTGRSKSPRYVKSPLTDPNEKIRTGSPREITIRTPVRGRSIKDPNKTLKSVQSNSSLRREPTVPNIEPDVVLPQRRYQHQRNGETRSPVRTSLLPRSLEWKRKESQNGDFIVQEPVAGEMTNGAKEKPSKGPRTPPELQRMVQEVQRFGRGEREPREMHEGAPEHTLRRAKEGMNEQHVNRWRHEVNTSGPDGGAGPRNAALQPGHGHESDRQEHGQSREHWHVERAPTADKSNMSKMNKEEKSEKPLPPLPLRSSGGWI